jgi:hypothetical protein
VGAGQALARQTEPAGPRFFRAEDDLIPRSQGKSLPDMSKLWQRLPFGSVRLRPLTRDHLAERGLPRLSVGVGMSEGEASRSLRP